MSPISVRLGLATFVVCAALALLAYAPAQTLPFISDDYLQIQLSRDFVSFEGLRNLASDALYRCRATSLFVTRATEAAFGIETKAFNLSSLAIHILNSGLVMLLGSWRFIGWRLAAIAAMLFAVTEGHHEAVIWYAALPELLVFTFVLGAFLLWIRWLETCRHWYWFASFACYLLALLSKESGVCVVGLIVLTVFVEGRHRRRLLLASVPFAITAAMYSLSIYAARESHLHFNDGTFSLRAPFLITLITSWARMLWVWGLAALLLIGATQPRRISLLGFIAGWWIIVLLPYSFLTYMQRVPSRHTYLASVALALLLAHALIGAWRKTLRAGAALRFAVATTVVVFLLHNVGYLWTRKHRQFRERAEVTESLLRAIRSTAGWVDVRCVPINPELARVAVSVREPEAFRRTRWSNARGGCTDLYIVPLKRP